MIKISRFYLGAALLVPLFFFSCTPQEQLEPEDEVISPETGDPGSSEGLVKMEFVGTQADDDGSRTYISGSKVLWKGSDKIAVIDDAAPYVHVFDNTDTEGGERCRFIGEAKAGEDTWTVVYPADAFSRRQEDRSWVTVPSEQTAVVGSFADGSYITHCRTTSKNITLKPLLSMLKIHIEYENIRQVLFQANANDTFSGTVRPLAGKFSIINSDENAKFYWVEEGSVRSDITLNPPAGESVFPKGDYYIPVMPLGDTDATNAFPVVQNLRLKFTRADGQIASRSLTGASIVFERGKYIDLGTVDEGLSWEYFDIEFGTADASYEGTSHLNWPFLTYRTSDDDGRSWTSHDAPADLSSLRANIAWNLEGKLKDSGHILRIHAEGPDEKIRYAEHANAIYLNGHIGSYIEFPAMPSRHLLRVEVDYDFTSVYQAKTGDPYLPGRPAGDCPHITTTGGDDVDYVLTRDGDSFHHYYDLYGTSDDTPYRYVIAYDSGTAWSGPRIQRVRLYYSKESRSMTLPEPTLGSISTSLRNFTSTLTLTDASEGSYEVGIVVRNALENADDEAPEGHEYDWVISLSNVAPDVAGTTLTWTTNNTLSWGHIRYTGDPGLSEENEIYAYVRKFGDTTDPRKMTPGTNDGDWRTSERTYIQRPSYTWTISPTENYLYASDTSVELTATVQVHSDVTQNYDVGFIYKVAGAEDTYSNWNCTYVDQNGVGKSTDVPTPANPIQGYELDDGDTKEVTATLTGLTAGETYVYKPVIIQHAACFYGKGGSPSSEAYRFEYILFEDGYTHSNDNLVEISGPVVAVGSKPSRVPTGYYTAAKTGFINESDINVSHVKCSTNFVTGYLYGTSAHPTAGIRTRNSSVFPYADGEGDAIVYETNHLNASDKLTGLTDSDGATCYYRPYFSFADGTVKYPLATDYTFTCPAVSILATDYLWQGYNSADIMETAALSVGTECKVEMAYSTDDGDNWSSTSSNLSAGEHTFSTVTVTEGGQTVKVRARRSGSSAAWQTADVVLAHPISSVTTYSSSFYPSRTMATVAGSFTTLKVASNDLVEYGFCYTESNGTSHHEEARASDAAQAYYTINISDGVGDAYDRGHRLLGYFFARLYGSSSIPTAKNAELYSSKSGGQMMTHSWASNLGYAKRLYVCFNELPVYESRSATNPFLPHAAEDSDYIDALSVTYGNLCQEKKALLTGGQSLEFHMTSSSSVASKNATISGACCNNGDGRMRVYAGTVDDYILLPALDDYKIARLVTWFWGGRGSDLWTEEEARGNVYIFLTTDEDYSAGDMKPSRVLPSYQTGTSFPADVQNWTTSLNEENFPYDTYSGKPLRLHFAGQSVSIGDYSHYPTTPPDRTEVRCTGFWIDYAGDPTP